MQDRRPRDVARAFPVRLLAWAAFLALAPAGASGADAITVFTDPAPGPAARHGLARLRAALNARAPGAGAGDAPATAGEITVILAGTTSGEGPAATALREAGLPLPSDREALTVRRLPQQGRPALVICGSDDVGLMYALLDTAARVGWNSPPADPLAAVVEVTEAPRVRHRSLSVYTMNRAHWESRFYDEAYWKRYFDLLAESRFNHFLVVFGYENGGFLAPPYPYFFDTPGYPDVRMVGLTPDEQGRNLAALNRMIELAHARGIEVGLGIWDHIYRGGVQTGGIEWASEYGDRPVPNTVRGVTTANLNAYTLASLESLLVAVPALDSLQFRIHEESGLRREEMDAFWREVFTLLRREKPEMIFEARAKGTPDSVIDTAVDLGVNLRIATKYWMEQMGLPFHPTHVNPPNQRDRRHGYADLLRYPRRYPMNWRLWNGGTTRVLLWGDPGYVRRFSASTSLYDSWNWEVCEPLCTKMEAQRPDMPTFDLLRPEYRYYDHEFERYWHFFQVWGRIGYNPETSPEVWRREFTRRFGAAAVAVEAGLHRASTILPRIVAAVYPYRLFPMTRGWAERQSLGASLAEYAKNDATDIQQFESFADAAGRIVAGGTTTRRTPESTSRWFDAAADAVLGEVRRAESLIGERRGAEFDATMTDLKILAHLARFHARRALAAVDYNLHLVSRDRAALDRAVEGERRAVAAWGDLVEAAGDRYAFDLAMGARNFDLCGHWRDEWRKLQSGLARLERERDSPAPAPEPAPAPGAYPARPEAGDTSPPVVEGERIGGVRPLVPLRITARVTDPSGVATVRLRYRHVTQFEDFETLEMERVGESDTFAATVPAGFVVPEWDFMYFLEALDRAGNGTQWPDLDHETPYILVTLER